VLGVIGAVLLGTGLAVGGVLLAIGIIVAVLVPLLPVLILGGVIWLIYRAARPAPGIATR